MSVDEKNIRAGEGPRQAEDISKTEQVYWTMWRKLKLNYAPNFTVLKFLIEFARIFTNW